MGKFAVVVAKGDVRDIAFRDRRSHGGKSVFYDLFVGDQRLGTMSRLSLEFCGWDAYSHKGLDLDPEDPERLAADKTRLVEGFKTQMYAAEYLIKHWELGAGTGSHK